MKPRGPPLTAVSYRADQKSRESWRAAAIRMSRIDPDGTAIVNRGDRGPAVVIRSVGVQFVTSARE